MQILCTICTDVVNASENLQTTSCGHLFHYDCLSEWISRSNTCPQCRRVLTNSCISRVYPTVSDEIPREMAILQGKLDEASVKLLSMRDNEELLKVYTLELDSRNAELRELNTQLSLTRIKYDSKKNEIASLKKKIDRQDVLIEAVKVKEGHYAEISRTYEKKQKIINIMYGQSTELRLENDNLKKNIQILKKAFFKSEFEKNELQKKFQAAENVSIVDKFNALSLQLKLGKLSQQNLSRTLIRLHFVLLSLVNKSMNTSDTGKNDVNVNGRLSKMLSEGVVLGSNPQLNETNHNSCDIKELLSKILKETPKASQKQNKITTGDELVESSVILPNIVQEISLEAESIDNSHIEVQASKMLSNDVVLGMKSLSVNSNDTESGEINNTKMSLSDVACGLTTQQSDNLTKINNSKCEDKSSEIFSNGIASGSKSQEFVNSTNNGCSLFEQEQTFKIFNIENSINRESEQKSKMVPKDVILMPKPFENPNTTSNQNTAITLSTIMAELEARFPKQKIEKESKTRDEFLKQNQSHLSSNRNQNIVARRKLVPKRSEACARNWAEIKKNTSGKEGKEQLTELFAKIDALYSNPEISVKGTNRSRVKNTRTSKQYDQSTNEWYKIAKKRLSEMFATNIASTSQNLLESARDCHLKEFSDMLTKLNWLKLGVNLNTVIVSVEQVCNMPNENATRSISPDSILKNSGIYPCISSTENRSVDWLKGIVHKPLNKVEYKISSLSNENKREILMYALVKFFKLKSRYLTNGQSTKMMRKDNTERMEDVFEFESTKLTNRKGKLPETSKRIKKQGLVRWTHMIQHNRDRIAEEEEEENRIDKVKRLKKCLRVTPFKFPPPMF